MAFQRIMLIDFHPDGGCPRTGPQFQVWPQLQGFLNVGYQSITVTPDIEITHLIIVFHVIIRVIGKSIIATSYRCTPVSEVYAFFSKQGFHDFSTFFCIQTLQSIPTQFVESPAKPVYLLHQAVRINIHISLLPVIFQHFDLLPLPTFRSCSRNHLNLLSCHRKICASQPNP